MIKMLTANTFEIDEPPVAVKELLDQLNLPENLMKNSAAIISCHYDFIFSGAVKAICESLPCETIGTVSILSAANGKNGGLMLGITVLTSDDCEFKAVCSKPLGEGYEAAIDGVYKEIESHFGGKPAMLFAYAPFLITASGDSYVNRISAISENTPCFGTLAVDDTADFGNSFAICNGEGYLDRLVILGVYGDVSPKYDVAIISGDKILEQSAVITKSNGHLLSEVNDQPLIEFFRKLGLANASEEAYALVSLPFVVDYNDGTPPVSKAFIHFDENGDAICAGDMPQGATLRMASFEKDDIIKASVDTLQGLIDSTDCQNFIIYSCLSRFMSLGGYSNAELDAVVKVFEKNNKSYFIAYSGGEICPTQIREGIAVNRFHNNSFVVCGF